MVTPNACAAAQRAFKAPALLAVVLGLGVGRGRVLRESTLVAVCPQPVLGAVVRAGVVTAPRRVVKVLKVSGDVGVFAIQVTVADRHAINRALPVVVGVQRVAEMARVDGLARFINALVVHKRATSVTPPVHGFRVRIHRLVPSRCFQKRQRDRREALMVGVANGAHYLVLRE